MDRGFVYNALRKQDLLDHVATKFRDTYAYGEEYASLALEEQTTWREKFDKRATTERAHNRSKATQVTFDCWHEADLIRNFREKLERELMCYIDGVAAPECRALCDKMQQRLPRELRDVVYEHLLEGSTRQVVHDNYTSTKNPRVVFNCNRYVRGSDVAVWPQNSVVVDERYTGKVTKTEIGEAWYRSCILVLDHLSDVNAFVHFDLWGFGLTARDHIRRVELRVYDFTRPYSTSAFSAKLQGLYHFSVHTRVVLDFFPSMYDGDHIKDSYGAFKKCMRGLLPAFSGLVDAGYALTLRLADAYECPLQEADLKSSFLEEKIDAASRLLDRR